MDTQEVGDTIRNLIVVDLFKAVLLLTALRRRFATTEVVNYVWGQSAHCNILVQR